MPEDKKFLENLVEAASPSGFENEIRSVLCEHLPESTVVEQDSYGNTVATLNPGADETVAFCSHYDEIGYMVRYVSEDGFIYLQAIGGVDETVARGQRVSIQTDDGPVSGVFGGKSIHLLVDDENRTIPKLEDLWVDIGVDTADAVRDAGVEVGDPVTFSAGLEELEDDTVAGRGLDNSIGMWATVDAFNALDADALDCTVKLVVTVLEETGMSGARMIREDLDFDAAVVVDTTFATGTPPIKEEKHGKIRLDEGPTLRHGKENHSALRQFLEDISVEADIPHQHEALDWRGPKEAMIYETTDADMFVSTGAPTAFVGVPTRYIHTPSEIVNMRDGERTSHLLQEFAQRFASAEIGE